MAEIGVKYSSYQGMDIYFFIRNISCIDNKKMKIRFFSRKKLAEIFAEGYNTLRSVVALRLIDRKITFTSSGG